MRHPSRVWQSGGRQFDLFGSTEKALAFGPTVATSQNGRTRIVWAGVSTMPAARGITQHRRVAAD